MKKKNYLDRDKLQKFLENYFDNHEFADMTFCSGGLADDICNEFKIKLVSLKQIEKVLAEYIVDESDGHHSVKQGLAQAVYQMVKESE